MGINQPTIPLIKTRRTIYRSEFDNHFIHRSEFDNHFIHRSKLGHQHIELDK